MIYHLKILAKAEKDLNAIKGRDFDFIKAKILPLAHDSHPFGSKKLTLDEGYRIRCGDFRILYRIDDTSKEVIIYRVKHRREAYR